MIGAALDLNYLTASDTTNPPATGYNVQITTGSLTPGDFGSFNSNDDLVDSGISSTAGLGMSSGQVVSWNGDTSISRGSAGVIDIGTGSAGSTAGSLSATALTLSGTLTAGTIAGAALSGTFTGTPTLNGALTFSGGPTFSTSAPSFTAGLKVSSGQVVSWNGDTGISRGSAGVIDIGTGAQGSTSASISAANLTVTGTVRANTGFNANGTSGISGSTLCSATITYTEGLITGCTAISDPRLKTFSSSTRGLSAILQLEPINFRWNDEGLRIAGVSPNRNREQTGFNAENVKQVMPEAVGTENHDGIDYLSLPQGQRPIVAELVNAVKEQQSEIEELKAEIAALRTGKD
jgi:hypothetical protein